MFIFEAKQITKRYAAQTALDKVSIVVPEQSIFGLLGPNGAGKTSLIRIINQITAPDEGELFFNDTKLTSHHLSQIGYLPEERGLYKKMKVGEQALYLAQLKGLSKKDALKKLKDWFEKFEIQAWWGKKVEELSKGMQQKVQFITTIIHEPKLLIFDEPFSGFDPINVNIIKEEILNARNNGATIIFSTHNMESVEELCDHIALINKAQKILDGKMKDIKKAYASNTFEISFDKFDKDVREVLNSHFQLIKQQPVDENVVSATIKLNDSATRNELLQLLMNNTTVHSFNEIIPTMNSIFIQKVTEN